MSAPRNLVLITVDCLRADALGAYGATPSPSPFLDRLAEGSWVAERAITAGLPTYYAFPAIHASRFPLAFGRDIVGLLPEEPTLASTLAAAGYNTAAFVAGNPYLARRERYDHGFTTYEDFLTSDQKPPAEPAGRHPLSGLRQALEAAARRHPVSHRLFQELLFQVWAWRHTRKSLDPAALRSYPAAHQMVDKALLWLEQTAAEKRPFFLWLHLMDPHHPYHPPQNALAALGYNEPTPERGLWLNALWSREEVGVERLERHREEILRLYRAGIRHVDQQLERLVTNLDQLALKDSTLLAVTADHGEEFLERGGRYHYPTHLTDELSRVPLLLRDPGGRGGRGEEPVSLLDLAPTLLHRLGMEPPGSFAGTSFWQGEDYAPEARPVITECVENRRNPWDPGAESGHRLLAVQDRRHKLVLRFNEGDEALYDLESDPGERNPLPMDSPHPTRAALLQAAHDHLRTHRPSPESASWRWAALARLEHRLRRARRRGVG